MIEKRKRKKSEDRTNAIIVAAVGILAGCAAVVAICSIVCRAHRGRAAGSGGVSESMRETNNTKKKKKKKKFIKF
jgi:hypothetical protein